MIWQIPGEVKYLQIAVFTFCSTNFTEQRQIHTKRNKPLYVLRCGSFQGLLSVQKLVHFVAIALQVEVAFFEKE